MTHLFCPGYTKAPYRALVEAYPGPEVYPTSAFRTEWGPIFHRGRLDGTARILVIGQDPAAHETIARRILVGEAGQRIQGFLTKLGIGRSYVFVNTFLYSVYGGRGATHVNDDELLKYRNKWLDAIVARNDIQAVLSLGQLADKAYQAWPKSATGTWTHANVVHPTYPESGSASGSITKKAAFEKLCQSWNTALDIFAAAGVPTPDTARPVVHYGTTLTDAEHTAIAEEDLPAGLPDWMRSLKAWAARTGKDAALKRATVTVTIPNGFRPPA